MQEYPFKADSVEWGGFVIDIVSDESPINPRKDCDNLGTMVCAHKRYDLGDRHDINPKNFDSWNDIEKHLRNHLNAAVVLPIYMYDHGGITINTKGFSCPFDSGQIGFIYATRAKICSNFNCKNITKKIKSRVSAILESEVTAYDYYLRGDAWGWVISKDGEVVDSCWGYTGNDFRYMLEEAKSRLESGMAPNAAPNTGAVATSAQTLVGRRASCSYAER